MSELEDEIDRNLEAFKAQLPALLEQHKGRYALMRRQEIVGVYDTIRDAQLTGRTFYEDGLFSVQKVTSEPVNLGFFSHAVSVADP